jgi:hypothetical protein
MGPNSLGPLAIYLLRAPALFTRVLVTLMGGGVLSATPRARAYACASLTRGAHSPRLPSVRAPLVIDWWATTAEIFFPNASATIGRAERTAACAG